jgi:predicted RNA-binding Zn-ribbon protein involved in translation (DUF1610 family)
MKGTQEIDGWFLPDSLQSLRDKCPECGARTLPRVFRADEKGGDYWCPTMTCARMYLFEEELTS